MESLIFTKHEGGFHIEGFPNAAKLVQLNSEKAQRLADLALHHEDLAFGAECLMELRRIHTPSASPTVTSRALWTCAVVHWAKCFGQSDARFNLDRKSVYRGEPPVALECFQYFLDLRNKHLVHDANSYAQSLPGAVVNKPDAPYKVAKIISFSAIADVLGQENFSNLSLLIDRAAAWVVAEFDRVCDSLTKELEAMSHPDLVAMKEVAYSKPTVDDMGKTRR